MIIRDAKVERNFDSIKICVENSGKVKFDEDNAKMFLDNKNTFFLIVYQDEKSTMPLAFTFGYFLPKPEYTTPSAYVYALENIKDNGQKGVGTYLINQLRVYMFYERPISDIMFLCSVEDKGLVVAIKRAYGQKIKTISPYIILNDNVDENGMWKGVPKGNEVVLEINDNVDIDDD